MEKTQKNKLGMNRTGKDTSPLLSKAMLKGTEELTLPLCPPGNSQKLAENRTETMKEWGAVGSVPPPASLKGAVKMGVEMLKGNNMTFLIDKLSERLAFEKTGVRLYEALISKFQANSEVLSQYVSFEKLVEIKNEEFEHFRVLSETIGKLGADSTAMTPSADVTALASTGIVKVLGEPRINFIQSLNAILVAELADNDSWKLLIEITSQFGLSDISSKFEECYRDEQNHLVTVQEWIKQLNPIEGDVQKKEVA
jgi:rubrerythrin